MENFDSNTLRYLAGIKNTIKECGIPMSSSHSPASINITAGSGQELTGMLKDIMNLAGVHKVEPEHMPVLTPDAGPSKVISATSNAMPAMQDLIKVVSDEETDPDPTLVQDSMNDDMRMYDNSPGEEGKAAGNWPLDGDQDNNLSANKDKVVDRHVVTTESLMAEYKKFISEEYDFSTISPRQRRALIQVVNKWSDVPGSYESTMLDGIWHAWCDSGIMTDGFSQDDARRVAAAGLEEFSYDHELDEINDAVKQQDRGDDLDCVKASNELESITDDNTDMETLCAYMKRHLLGESKNFKKKVDEGRDVFGDEEEYYDDSDDDDFSFNSRRFARPGSALHAADDNNPRNLPCPTCNRPNRLTPLDKMKGYQCDRCADAMERGTEINYYDNDIDNDDDTRENLDPSSRVKSDQGGRQLGNTLSTPGQNFDTQTGRTLPGRAINAALRRSEVGAGVLGAARARLDQQLGSKFKR